MKRPSPTWEHGRTSIPNSSRLGEWILLRFFAITLGGVYYALWRQRCNKATTSSSDTWEKSSKNSPTA